MLNRKDVRIKVDWDNDGFINQKISPNTPINLLPLAAYSEGFRARVRKEGKQAEVNEIKEVDNVGFTALKLDRNAHTQAEFGATLDHRVTPVGENDNEFDFDDYPVLGVVVVENPSTPPPIDAPVYGTTILGAGTVIDIDNIPVSTSVDGWMVSTWVRFRATGLNALADEFSAILTLSGVGVTSTQGGAGFSEDAGDMTDGVWTIWLPLGSEVSGQPTDNLIDILLTISAVWSADTIDIEFTHPLLLPIELTNVQADNLTIQNETNCTVTWTSSQYDVNISGTGVAHTWVLDMVASRKLLQGQSIRLRFDFHASVIDGDEDMRAKLVRTDTLADISDEWSQVINITDATSVELYIKANYLVAGQAVTADEDLPLSIHFELTDNDHNTDYELDNMELDFVDYVFDRFWESPKALAEHQMPIKLPSGTAHNVSFHIKSSVAENANVVIYSVDITDGTTTQLATDTYALTTDYKRFNTVIPSQIADFYPYITITPVGAATISYYKGCQITTGSTVYEYNVGVNGQYDDITEYVLSASWKLGRDKFTEPISYEGTLELELNNDSRLFSPDNTNSPIASSLQQNRKIVLELKHNGVWHPLWTGWTFTYDVQGGRTNQRRVSLTCQQGVYRLREGEFSVLVDTDVYLHDLIFELILRSGWRSAKSPFNWVLNLQSNLGVSTYLTTQADIFTDFDLGLNTLDTVGMDWGRETKLEDAIKELLTSEYAKLMVGRDGGLLLHNRERYINAPSKSQANLVLDTYAHEVVYTYGEDIVNRIEVMVKPKKEVKGEVIWETPTPVRIAGWNYIGWHAKVTEYVPMHFTFEESRQRTITNIDSTMESMNITVYHGVTKEVLDAGVWSGQVWAAILGDGGNKFTLQLRNNLEHPVEVDVQITGDYLEAGQSQSFVLEDVPAQELVGAIHYELMEVNQLDNFDQAKALAQLELRRRSTPRGEIESIRVYAHNDTLLTDLLAYGVGDIVTLSEVQSGLTNSPHIIIGETGEYAAGGELSITYTLSRTDNVTYPVVDTGDMQKSLNLLPVPDVIDASWTVVDKMTLERVPYVSDIGNTALKFHSWNLNSMIWLGQTTPELYKVFSNRQGKYLTNTTGSPTAISQIDERRSWNENEMAHLRTNVGSRDEIIIGSSTTAPRAWGRFASKRVSILVGDYDKDFFGDGVINLDWRMTNDDIGGTPSVDETRNNTVIVDAGVTATQADIDDTDKGYLILQQYYKGNSNGKLFLYLDGGGSAVEFWAGDVYIVDLDKLERTTLKASTQYHITLWGAADVGETVNIEVVVVEFDGDNTPTEHTVAMTLTDTHGKHSGTFTTTANGDTVALGLRYKGLSVPLVSAYVSAITLTEAAVTTETPDELNEIRPEALRAYV